MLNISEIVLQKLNRLYRNDTNRLYRPAVLGDTDGTIADSQLPGNVIVRMLGANGLSVGRSVTLGTDITIPYTPNTPVRLGRNGQRRDVVMGIDQLGYMASGVNPVGIMQRQQSGSTPQSDMEQFRCLQASPPSLFVKVRAWNPIVDGVGYQFGGDEIDLTAAIPGTANYNCYAVVALKSDFSTLEYATSTARDVNDVALNVDDENEALQALTSGSTPCWAVVLTNGQTTITQSDIDNFGLDLRNFVNVRTGQAGGEATDFTQTNTVTVANTVTETAISGTGIGSLTLPANQLKVGKNLRVRAWGVLSSKAAAAGNLTIKIKLGSTVILSTTAIALTTSLSNNLWQLDSDMTCRAVGGSGTIMAQGVFRTVNTLADIAEGMSNGTSTITVDTTGTLALSVTAQFSVNDVANTISCTNLTVEELN